ncbi:pyrimidine utilization protein D [Acinetobacter sp. 194]|uniref:pyrimidine utilization protein D n=1 Tax=Acinetobacter shaoyimingii TaxID=2715164 RepID=UPI00140BAA8D|nr:pyrimidine utilization protein D [Acinetobacter shaoyimingii]NHB58445.1 pyrimidine utilization protein D [Acinetobacter shaoyimingii]
MEYQLYPCLKNQNAEYLVLSSGLGGHGNFWAPQIAFFQEHFHVFTYDQEGCHANTQLLKKNYTMEDLALQLFNLIQAAEIKSFHFIGHALGGFIGAELARISRYSDLNILSLTVINGWAYLDAHTLKCFQTRIALLKQAGIQAYVEAQALFLYTPAWISRNIQTLMQQENKQIHDFPPAYNVLTRLNALMSYEMPEETEQVLRKIPLHILANKDDFLVPYHQSQALAEKFIHAECVLLDSGGHAATVTEASMMNDTLLSLIQKSNASQLLSQVS